MDAFVVVSASVMKTKAADTESPRADLCAIKTEARLSLMDANADADALIELDSDEMEVLRLAASSASAIVRN